MVKGFLQIRLLACLVLSLLFLGGCAIVAISAESFRKSGYTAESRRELLPSFVARYSDSISWVDSSRALAFASDTYKPVLRTKLLKEKDKVKFIGAEVLLTEFNDDATRAEVSVRSRFYRIPVYIAEEKTEKQIWVYDGGAVWKIDAVEEIL